MIYPHFTFMINFTINLTSGLHIPDILRYYSTRTYIYIYIYIKSGIKKPKQRKGIVVNSTPALKSHSTDDLYHIKQM